MQGLQIVIQKRPSQDETASDIGKDTKRQSFFNCLLCNEERDETFELLQCNHMVHKTCCEEYINLQMQEVSLPQIKCPRRSCKRFLRDQLIQNSLRPEFQQKYQHLVLRRINEKESKVKVCPKTGCSRMFNHDNENPYTKCGCDSQICNTCYNLAHEGVGCVEAMKSKFPKYAKKRNLKYCYKCRTIVIDSEACNLIKCPGCSMDWCWDCGQNYGEGHEYSCYGRWNPPIPKEEDEEAKPKTFIGRTLQFFLSLVTFLVLLPIKTIFWPFILLNVPQEVLSDYASTAGKTVLVSVAVVLTLTYNGLIGLLYYFMNEYPEYTIVFIICDLAAIACPWVLLLLAAYSTQENEPPTLEMKINNLRYNQPQPQPAQAQQEEQVKKGLLPDGEPNGSTMAQSPGGGLNQTQSVMGLLEKHTTLEIKEVSGTGDSMIHNGEQTPGYAVLIDNDGTDE